MKPYLHRLLAFALFLLVMPLVATAQSWQWAELGRGPDHDAAERVHLDSVGNTYVLGRFAGTIAFGNRLLSGIGLWDTFVAKFDAAGRLQWATSVTGPGNDLPGDIVVDRQGNIYISGSYAGSTIVNGTAIQSTGMSDVYVARLAPNGNAVWVRTGGGTGLELADGIALDESGSTVYVAGSFTGTASFSGDVITSAGGSDIFVAAYSTAQGGIQWVRGGGGPNDDAAIGLGVDRFGSAFVAGTFSDSASFLGHRVITPGSDSGAVFIAKYDFAGIPRWATSTGVLPRSFGPVSLGVDVEGNAYLAGSFTDTLVIDEDTLVSRGGSDAFLARYNPFGGYRWAVQEGDTLNEYGLGVGVDNAGTAFLTGAHSNRGGIVVDTSNRERLFLARYTPNGEKEWINLSPGGRIERGFDVGVDRRGNQVVTGGFADTLRLDDVRLVATGGSSDAFIAKLGPDATIVTTALADSVFCAGTTVNVSYTIGGTFFDDNIFAVQLSDSSGGFDRPMTIGTRTTAAPGLIVATIPDTVRSGSGYRMRVIGTSPAVLGADNGEDVDIVGVPIPTIALDGNDTICAGETVTLDPGPGYVSYRWSTGATSRTIAVSQSGVYTVSVTALPGCDGTSAPVRIVVFPYPEKPVIARIGTELRIAAASRHQWYRDGVAIPDATRERFTPTASGSYTVTVFNEAGCSMTSDPFEFSTTSVDDDAASGSISIVRNSADRLSVTGRDGACRLAVTLVDIRGAVVREASGQKRVTIDLDGLAAGAYVLRAIGCDGRETVRKVVR